MQKFIINSQIEMQKFAEKLAENAKTGDIFCLNGTLGAGKTFFAKSFINFLQDKPTAILSPTFNLVYDYQTKKGEVFHFDLYRLKSADELENIGFFDALKNGICLIEWPQLALNFLGKNFTKIDIKIISEEKREVVIS